MEKSLFQFSRLLILSVLVAATACGGDAKEADFLQACVKPPNSFELCYETRSHSRPIGDILKGSPGISLRYYGRSKGNDVPLMVLSGGPTPPGSWSEHHGDIDCYIHGVDFPAAISAIEHTAVPKNLESQKQFVLKVLKSSDFTDSYKERDIERCRGVTPENMEDPFASAQSSGLKQPLRSRQAPADGTRDSATHTLTFQRCIPAAEGSSPLCFESVRLGPSGQAATVHRIAYGPNGAYTLLAKSPGPALPQSWLVADDDYNKHMDEVDWVALAAQTGSAYRDEPQMQAAILPFYQMIFTMSNAVTARESGIQQEQQRSNNNAKEESKNHIVFLGSAGDWRNRGRKHKQGSTSVLYRTTLKVYAKKALLGLVIHSGTRTHVEGYADNGWVTMLNNETCNHGACPSDTEDMEHRFDCDPGVVTPGWYGFDGECSDHWPSHTCNDDTALQINNAYGRWSEDRCYDTGRKHAPRCKPQW